MATYIKGMEMPTSCRSCPFENGGDCYGGKHKYIMDVDDDEELFRSSRHPKCPLVYIPEPHGRLIDADELTKECHYLYQSIDHFIPSKRAKLIEEINDTPTVIEGSE